MAVLPPAPVPTTIASNSLRPKPVLASSCWKRSDSPVPEGLCVPDRQDADNPASSAMLT